MSLLEGKDISVRYGELSILRGVNFTLEEHQWLMIVGPNGAGKSTLVGAVSGSTPYTGTILCKGRDIRELKPRELARRIGVLSQNHAAEYSFTVGEVVKLGRYAWAPSVFSAKKSENEEKIAEALRLTGLEKLRNMSVLTLSGGELQRTFLAQVIAQDPEIMILDEPTNHLDLIYQKQIFSLIHEWIREPGRAVISVVHDLSLARAYGTHALLLHHGETVSQGAIGEVMTPENLEQVYSMDVYGWMRKMLGQWEENKSENDVQSDDRS